MRVSSVDHQAGRSSGNIREESVEERLSVPRRASTCLLILPPANSHDSPAQTAYRVCCRFLDVSIFYYLDSHVHLWQHVAGHLAGHFMLSLSLTTGYAVLALSCLRQCDRELVLAKDIAKCTGIPLPYLLKLLHAMRKAGLVTAKRGYRGGFALTRPAERISLLEVAEAVDGQKWLPRCLLGLDDCSDKRQCPTHDFWKIQRRKIEAKLRQTTVRDVAEHEARQASRRLGRCCAPGAGHVATKAGARRRSTNVGQTSRH